MKLSERIKQFIAERAAKVAALEGVQEKALKDGRSKDKQEQEQFDELMSEIEAIDKELSDLRRMEKLMVAQATVVDPDEDDDGEVEAGETPKVKSRAKTVDDGGAVEGRGRVIAVVPKKLQKGILFARYVKCLGAARGDLANAVTLAKLHYPDTPQIAQVLNHWIADPTARHAAGKKARTLVETQYTWDRVALDTEQAYRDYLSSCQ